MSVILHGENYKIIIVSNWEKDYWTAANCSDGITIVTNYSWSVIIFKTNTMDTLYGKT